MMKLALPHLDANQNVFLARSLEHIDPTQYYELFAGLLARRFIPDIQGVPPEADTYTYNMVSFTGQADLGAPGHGANDDAIAGVTRTEVKTPIKEIPTSFEWEMRAIEQAAKYNVPLDTWTIQAAMTMIARKIDRMLAFGVAGTAIKGLLNNSGVNAVTATTKTGGQIEWAANTAANELAADVIKLGSAVRAQLSQAGDQPGGEGIPAFDSFTFLLPSAEYSILSSTPRFSNDGPTILRWLVDNVPWIDSIEEWRQCDADAAYATSGGLQFQRMVCYPRNAMCVGALVPSEWRQRAPQEVGHKVVTPASGLCGGTVIRYPVACGYMNLHD